MWLATKFGFFSIVLKRDGFHVRARTSEDLDCLKSAAGVKAPVVVSHDTDYCARVIVDQAGLGRIMAALVETLDYRNFKGMIAENPSQRDKGRWYFEIWERGRDYQEERQE